MVGVPDDATGKPWNILLAENAAPKASIPEVKHTACYEALVGIGHPKKAGKNCKTTANSLASIGKCGTEQKQSQG